MHDANIPSVIVVFNNALIIIGNIVIMYYRNLFVKK